MSDKRADARNVSGTEARLAKPFGSRLDRTQPLRFTFEGHPYVGFKGDTVASALAASGQFVLSRSFKYHRARGAVTMAGHDANTLVQTPDNPNALADREPLTDGLSVNPVNVSGSLMRDRYRLLGWLSRFLPVGFYYKAF
ncbi:MAG: (2Fe-2S)-binding protein, partial [Pseudomonadota bacterium]